MLRRPFVIAALGAALAAAAGGLTWERARFGAGPADAGPRLEAEVRHRLIDSAARLRAVAERVARDHALIAAATTAPDRRAELFAALDAARLPTSPLHAVTLYVPDGSGGFRLLAWSDGPAEDLDAQAALVAASGAPAIVVSPGALGLRLLAIHPVTDGSRSIGLVTAERIIAPGDRLAGTTDYPLVTALGEVRLSPAAAPPTTAYAIVVNDDRGRPLVHVSWDPATVAQARTVFRGRTWAAALAPLLALAVWAASTWVLARRRRANGPAFAFWSAGLALLLLGAGLATRALTQWASLSLVTGQLAVAAAALGAAVAWPVSCWWRGVRRRAVARTDWRLPLALIGAGAWVAVLLAGLAFLIDTRLAVDRLDRLASPLFPFDAGVLWIHLTRLILALAAIWSGVTVLALVVERWRVQWRGRWGVAVIALGSLPAAALSAARPWWPSAEAMAPIVVAAALLLSVAALAAAPLRRRYRHSTQSTRLLWLCGATVLPALIIDPIVSVSAQRATDTAIETVHAPATVDHPAHLLEVLRQATAEIDGLGDLSALVDRAPGAAAVTTDAAFRVWSRTGLSRERLTSAVDLYGPDRTLTSRFALNVPEYGFDQSMMDLRCDWDIYGEVDRSEELRMLHAERGVCDAAGRVRGAIVLHVIFDYRALPYLAARSPFDVHRRPEGAGALADRLQVVVYGWSRLPLFASGPAAWPLDDALLARLERSRDPFWITRTTDAGRARVYFRNDRAGIYALGYTEPSAFEHLSRLAETTALALLVFVVLIAGASAAAAISPPARAPFRAVVDEVRTSFYRKLFLLFVLTALLPVAVLALAFSAYMGEQLRSDVETEAISAATIARRVLEDTIALQQGPLTDDLMVWIGRIINQDVNVYDGPRLRATSQRDLFDSGVLPERTPARAYRAVALDRVPTFVEESQAGLFTSLVAAAPVPRLGREAVLLVPLAPRQRAIEREISDLNRGILLGAILIVLLSAGLGAWVAQRVADPVARLTRATRQIASGRLDVRIAADTADELQRLVTDFNSMAATLREQRAELVRTHELKAWAEMSRQVAHDVKNPLTPIQLAAEHLQRVHDDRQRPLGPVFDQCIATILQQVRLLRQIASEFSNFAAAPTPTLVDVRLHELLTDVIAPYLPGLASHTRVTNAVPADLPPAYADRTLLARALTNLVENALQAMPQGGDLRCAGWADDTHVVVTLTDTGIGMNADALARAFEPHFSTKTGGSGLGLANARRNIEACGGIITADSAPQQGTTMTVRLRRRP